MFFPQGEGQFQWGRQISTLGYKKALWSQDGKMPLRGPLPKRDSNVKMMTRISPNAFPKIPGMVSAPKKFPTD